jgi:hypothetical protein
MSALALLSMMYNSDSGVVSCLSVRGKVMAHQSWQSPALPWLFTAV